VAGGTDLATATSDGERQMGVRRGPGLPIFWFTNPPKPRPVFVTPASDPVAHPKDAGTIPGSIPDGANEFTYSSATTGVLTIKLKASVTALAGASQATKDKFKFEVDGIGNSAKVWATGNTDGKPTITGDMLEAVVTFTGLPENNADFGAKTAKVLFDGQVTTTQIYEVFFPRDAANHPGGQSGSLNWYHYWSQVAAIPNLFYGGPRTDAATAETVGITQWSYTTAPDKLKITVYQGMCGKFKSYGVGKEFSGIDRFIGSLLHEAKHVDQIARADILLPSNGSDSFRYGWSWNKGGQHNHWAKGPDGQWGRAGIDDDGNGVMDDAASAPPFEPGNILSDDILIEKLLYFDWPEAWTLPSNPNKGGSGPIEAEAIDTSDSGHNENQSAESDWGNPGKNHKTINKWND
jgi:hypothetical protein